MSKKGIRSPYDFGSPEYQVNVLRSRSYGPNPALVKGKARKAEIIALNENGLTHEPPHTDKILL